MSINRQQRRSGPQSSAGPSEPPDLEALAGAGVASSAGAARGVDLVQPGETEGTPSPSATRTLTGQRATPRQFLHEVNVEMRKVAWPTKAETLNYSTVVFITLAIIMALIFGLDIGFSKLSVFLFK